MKAQHNPGKEMLHVQAKKHFYPPSWIITKLFHDKHVEHEGNNQYSYFLLIMQLIILDFPRMVVTDKRTSTVEKVELKNVLGNGIHPICHRGLTCKVCYENEVLCEIERASRLMVFDCHGASVGMMHEFKWHCFSAVFCDC